MTTTQVFLTLGAICTGLVFVVSLVQLLLHEKRGPQPEVHEDEEAMTNQLIAAYEATRRPAAPVSPALSESPQSAGPTVAHNQFEVLLAAVSQLEPLPANPVGARWNVGPATDFLLTHITTPESLARAKADVAVLIAMAEAGELGLVVGKPKRTRDAQIAFVKKVVGSLSSPEIRETLTRILGEGDLTHFSDDGLKRFSHLWEHALHDVPTVYVETAAKLTSAQQLEVLGAVRQHLGHPAVLQLNYNPELTSGAALRVVPA